MAAVPTNTGVLDGGPPDREAVLAAFHEELRQRNVGVLLWSTTIFDLCYLGWAGFDWWMEPDLWRSFLLIRVAVALFGTALALGIHLSGQTRYTWEALWIWLFACGAGISIMLPHVGDGFLGYVLGYSLILYGAGLLPFWRPTWAASNVLAILVTAPLAFALSPSPEVTDHMVAGLFFVLTGAGASLVMASFKYGLARSDFLTRAELARTSEQLREALVRVEAHDRMKSRFFANISHELRTPLTLILSPVQAILGEPLSEPIHRDLRTVEQNAERLLRLIDDLLDLSRLDAGGLRLKLSVFDLGAILRSNVERSRPAALQRQLRIVLDVPPELPQVLGDEHRMEIVVANLLGNAIKYAEPGGRIQVRVLQIDGALRVEVEDDGPGISPEDLSRVFDRFFQSQAGQDRRAGGVGIGLALARELVELHGGAMDLKSVLGEGSIFGFTVPLGQGHIRPEVIDRRSGVAERRSGQREGRAPGRRETDAPPLLLPEVDGAGTASPSSLLGGAPIRLEQGRRPRILLAEDQDDLRAFIVGLFQPDFEVIEAADGDRAWELVRSERPDLVLSDVMMPGRSGSELCREIKGDLGLNGIPVILLTARAGTESTLKAYADGADDFVAKPFHPRVLVARVNAQLKLRALSAELAQREKLAAVGTLAAGILHEVRNPVNALLSAARTLVSGSVNEQTRSRLLEVVRDATERIHDLTWTLDAHVRPSDPSGPGLSDLRECMDATLRLLEHRLGEVRVHREDRGEGLARVAGGPINQVFLNLLDNALKAGARQIWVRIDAGPDRVRVTVADDGHGVPAQVRARIFDPFFTTAEPGRGTGLGLYLSRAIVEQAGGSITNSDREGGGTTFTIDLPGEHDAPRATEPPLP